MTGELRCELLAKAFPTLKKARGVAPFVPDELDRWATEDPACTDGALHAARFVLSVWNSFAKWRCGEFRVVDAMGTWDGAHRAAFIEWANAPWGA